MQGRERTNQCHAPAQVGLAWIYLKVNQSQSSFVICSCSRGPTDHPELKASFFFWGGGGNTAPAGFLPPF